MQSSKVTRFINKRGAITKSAAEPDNQKYLTMNKQRKAMKNKTMNKYHEQDYEAKNQT